MVCPPRRKGGSKPVRNAQNNRSAGDNRLVFQKWDECSMARRAAVLHVVARVATEAPSPSEDTFNDDSEGGPASYQALPTLPVPSAPCLAF